MELNEAQRRAVDFGVGDGPPARDPLLVLAGAGSGKTLTLARRVAALINAGVAADRLMLLTFSRRAADEMRRRASAALAEMQKETGRSDLRLPWAGTFHSVGSRLLRLFAPRLGLPEAFTILDRSDAADLLDLKRQEAGFARSRKRSPNKDACLEIYSRCVNTQLPLAEVLNTVFPWCAEWEAELRELFRAYRASKQAQGTLDFDDLLLYWLQMVRSPQLARELSDQFDHILVDEYQDTNVLQAQILFAMKPQGNGLTVVGDDAQSIYSFRAATIDNILEFPNRCQPRAEVVALTTNYRSTQGVLDAANALLADATTGYEKPLCSARGRGRRPRLVTVQDEDGQTDYVIDAILTARERGVMLREQAVLFRNASHSDGLELALLKRDIPYVKYGGLKFLEAAHVKDLLAALRWVENPADQVAAYRVLKLLPGVGPRTAQNCFAALREAGSGMVALANFNPPAATRDVWPQFVRTFQALHSEPGWPAQFELLSQWYAPLLQEKFARADARQGDIDQLLRLAGKASDRTGFLTELTLDPPAMTADLAGPPHLDDDYLVLSTVHSAKGQEWSEVYVLHVADGNFPSEFATGSRAQTEEERRLLYVAMTRARNRLDLVCPLRFYVPRQPRCGDRHVYGARSRFLTPSVTDCFDEDAYASPNASGRFGLGAAAVDIAAQIPDL